MKITADTVVDRPVAEVFTFCAANHHLNHPRWDSKVTRLEPLDPGGPALGTRFTMTRKLMGKREVREFRYTEWEPGKRMGYQSVDGLMPFRVSSSFTPTSPDATRITFHGEAELHGPRVVLVPFLRPLFQRQIRANLSRIKQLIESGGCR